MPLTGRRIPVITDDYVDRDFGTGVVKVTPRTTSTTTRSGQRHGLPMINIFTETSPWSFRRATTSRTRTRGLDRFDARKAIVADLEAAGLLVEVKPHKLQVPRGDRSSQVIEPFLTDQWFVNGRTRPGAPRTVVESGDVKFVPPNWINTYRHWLENIQDWTISRQLWWGHRIPRGSTTRQRLRRPQRGRGARRARAGEDIALAGPDVLEPGSPRRCSRSAPGWPDEDTMGALD